MQAIRVQQFGDPSVLKLEHVPDPTPGHGQVVVNVRAIGINPFETYQRAGTYPVKPPLPYTPGADAAGVVESVGDGVAHFKPGDRVYVQGSLSGTYAAKALCDQRAVHPLPAKISFEQGAALGVPYLTAYYALFFRGAAKAGETVLISGASGGVGTAAVQLARAFGLTVIGTAGTDKGRALATESGAHRVFDHHVAGYLDEIRKATDDARGVDLILEMAAHTNLGKDPAALAKGGRIVVVGSRGPVEINPRDLMSRDADIRAMTIMNTTDAQIAAGHMAIVAGLENGSLRPVVGQAFSLADAPKAHEAILAPGSFGKIILQP